MRGLDPRIPAHRPMRERSGDRRVKPGDDGFALWRYAFVQIQFFHLNQASGKSAEITISARLH